MGKGVPKVGEEAGPDSDVRRASIHVAAGALRVLAEPAWLSTVVGSCVAVCLWDPATKIGGMNHFMLPDRFAARPASTRFASVANPELLSQVLSLGAHRATVRAKVFGGACVLDAFRGNPAPIGARNVEAALAFLREESIAVAASEVEGRYGRKILFHTGTGTAYVKELRGGGDGL